MSDNYNEAVKAQPSETDIAKDKFISWIKDQIIDIIDDYFSGTDSDVDALGAENEYLFYKRMLDDVKLYL